MINFSPLHPKRPKNTNTCDLTHTWIHVFSQRYSTDTRLGPCELKSKRVLVVGFDKNHAFGQRYSTDTRLGPCELRSKRVLAVAFDKNQLLLLVDASPIFLLPLFLPFYIIQLPATRDSVHCSEVDFNW
ncbi:hypothetical protein RIF29_16907 [Crotalaria pallida]|uniref:Uncharacterized protein n=1 Tax=Crotalaria pallida TaxID=3830 RepID=A0AAN9IFZ4_CROPI